ncbi:MULTISPECIES: (Fe-S)-binding protein [unclassified Nitratiruptor]|uniref:(Fe-S)-binding protein n=1 Tax=unclassified Nitratiruptor TaxID=2624044 RepID=UPI001916C70C|nr:MULTISPECIES: (Fe-S)-binding protein [unclassified Nitratiruptor]BCD59698.1 glycolate oxidase iron-sulfur subunit [Nitratiruptor sp. YY08-10]BCD63622.1 glycolate oxidase iron-sulfur subunit [Nitratiruptor sp. YY08-14]
MFEFTSISNACIKCGKCIPTCTIHQVNPDEVTSPRGFIELLGDYQKGEIELDKTAKDIFESCFLCTNCVDVCPNSLPTDMIIEEVRHDIAQKYGIAWYKRAFFWLLRNRWAMDLFSKLGYVFKSCALQNEPKGRGLLPKFDLPMIKKDRLLPSMKSKSFLNKYPTRMNKNGKSKVAIFIGCLANYNYTEIGDGLVEILKRLDYEIFIPKKQLCCGAPAYFTGDFDTVEYLTKKNIEYFETFIDEVEAIIIPEATCSAMIKHDWEVFFTNRGMQEWAKRAKKVNEKIFMATQWLANHTDLTVMLEQKGRKFDEVVTYHDACHARKVQGIWKEPRELLGKSFQLVEMEDPNRCCGFGGVTIQTEKFHLAQAAGKPKAAMIEQSGAKIVSAECSACRVQISNSLYQNGVNAIFKNPIELIAKALKES